MEKEIAKKLNWFYYGSLVLAVIVAAVMLLMVKKQLLLPLDPLSAAGQAIQYVVIVYILASVPGGLYLFKRKCDKIKQLESEEEKYAQYFKPAMYRLIVIGLGISLGIFAFYMLGGYQSMIWCAAIAAIGIYFCKPLAGKIQIDLFAKPEDN